MAWGLQKREFLAIPENGRMVKLCYGTNVHFYFVPFHATPHHTHTQSPIQSIHPFPPSLSFLVRLPWLYLSIRTIQNISSVKDFVSCIVLTECTYMLNVVCSFVYLSTYICDLYKEEEAMRQPQTHPLPRPTYREERLCIWNQTHP